MAEGVKTIEELITALRNITPQLDNIAERIIKENPETATNGIMLGKIIGIFTLDFLMYAYGKGTRGYIHKPSKN